MKMKGIFVVATFVLCSRMDWSHCVTVTTKFWMLEVKRSHVVLFVLKGKAANIYATWTMTDDSSTLPKKGCSMGRWYLDEEKEKLWHIAPSCYPKHPHTQTGPQGLWQVLESIIAYYSITDSAMEALVRDWYHCQIILHYNHNCPIHLNNNPIIIILMIIIFLNPDLMSMFFVLEKKQTKFSCHI